MLKELEPDHQMALKSPPPRIPTFSGLSEEEEAPHGNIFKKTNLEIPSADKISYHLG